MVGKKLPVYICAINQTLKHKAMTHTIEVAKGFEVTVNIYSDCVITITNYLGTTRKNSYSNIQDLMNNTTIAKLADFCKSI